MNFNQQYDKLKPDRFRPYELFTTFRKNKSTPWQYYKFKIFPIKLNGREIGKARLIAIREMNSQEMTETQIKADTYASWGYEDWANFINEIYGGPIDGALLFFEVMEASKWI